MNTKITLPELVELVAEAANTTQRMSELFLRELFATVTEALIAGENVSIKDLGTFRIQRDASDTSCPNKLLFQPAKKLAVALNQPFEAFVPVVIDDDVTNEELKEAFSVDEAAAGTCQSQLTGDEPQDEPETAMDVDDESEVVPPAEDEGDLSSDAYVQPEPMVAAVMGASAEANPDISEQAAHEVLPQSDEESTGTAETSDGFDRELLEQVKNQTAKTSFWKGLAIGFMAGIVTAFLFTGISRVIPYSSDPAAVPDTTPVDTVKTEKPTAVEEHPVITDTISKTNYLTKMAIRHYGKQEFWVYIYEENKMLIDNPNHIKPGTVLVIPPAEKYGIDANNQTSVDKAKQLSFELFSKYKE